MRVDVIGSENAAWAAAMAAAGADDVYYHLHYHLLYCSRQTRCLAYVASRGGEVLFFPFILRPIDHVGSIQLSPQLYDIETVYGYTGPVATTASRAFLDDAWRPFKTWCLEHSIVAEFIRFHPILRTQRFAAPQADVILDRETVVIDLTGGEQGLWQSYSSTQRNRVRKALRAGLVCREGDLEDDLEAFIRLYEGTMRRCGAASHYFFPPEYYQQIRRNLAAHTKIFVVEHQGCAIAAGLFFVAGDTVHYHLGGSAADAQQFAPNNLLFHHVALWGERAGLSRLHLGGGRSRAQNDLLLRFKKKFSPQHLQFFIGQRIHNTAQYERLSALWLSENPDAGSPRYFPIYRAAPARESQRDDAA